MLVTRSLYSSMPHYMYVYRLIFLTFVFSSSPYWLWAFPPLMHRPVVSLATPALSTLGSYILPLCCMIPPSAFACSYYRPSAPTSLEMRHLYIPLWYWSTPSKYAYWSMKLLYLLGVRSFSVVTFLLFPPLHAPFSLEWSILTVSVLI